MTNQIKITVFTDPTCPYAFSAEPTRWRLKWLYGDQLSWSTKMIVLSGSGDEKPKMTPEHVSQSRIRLREAYGMPMSDQEPDRVAESLLACKAFVAASLYAPEKADDLLRFLRVASMSGQMIDEPSVIREAAQRANIDASKLFDWLEDGEVNEELAEGVRLARSPSNVALNMSHKLSKTPTGIVRYPAPSYIFEIGDKVVFELPGFWPLKAYEAAIGNFLPGAKRKKNAKSVKTILEWAKTPLATVEVATIYARSIEETRQELENIARFKPVGQDGFWVLR